MRDYNKPLRKSIVNNTSSSITSTPNAFASHKRYKSPPIRWKDPEGGVVAGAGILIYDDTGIWTILEDPDTRNHKKPFEYNDIGGKYKARDRTLTRTIKRELEEETYHSLGEISIKDIEELWNNPDESFVRKVTIYGKGEGTPKYICLLVHKIMLPNINLDPKNFTLSRQSLIEQHPTIKQEHISTLSLHHFTFEEVAKNINDRSEHYFSDRLIKIIKGSNILIFRKNS